MHPAAFVQLPALGAPSGGGPKMLIGLEGADV
jgi:hypothetical protein